MQVSNRTLLRKTDKNFRDNGDYKLILHFYEGGLRSPVVTDKCDKQKIKEVLTDFLRLWDKTNFTGQLVFPLRHSEFKPEFTSFPGKGSFDENKQGDRYVFLTRRDSSGQEYYVITPF